MGFNRSCFVNLQRGAVWTLLTENGRAVDVFMALSGFAVFFFLISKINLTVCISFVDCFAFIRRSS